MNRYSLAIWITGLSASGKTTLANIVSDRLRARGVPLIMLDGDNLREILGETAHYKREDRKQLAFLYARLVQSMSKQGIVVVIATVALFKEVHEWNRKNIEGYFEVFLDVPFDELRRRDPKQIYKRFDEGKINNVAGLDFSIDTPVDPHVRLDFDPNVTPEMNANLLLDKLAAIIDI
jgi:cytidine diphosphoramidate kinase